MNPKPNSDTGHVSTAWLLIFAAWLLSAISTLGALFFGEVMEVPTCSLCWYQRIFMFPLAVILPLGLFPLDLKVIRYTLPLPLLGGLLAGFQLLLIEGVIPESIQPCSKGVPCSETFVEWFGFLTIPMMSIAAFSTIAVLLVAARFRGSQ